jgi:hypothetical protein
MRRNKATKEENVANGCLSMIVDGAGAQASNYCPRYNTSEKSEPARHKMLKIKSTYVKVKKIVSIFFFHMLYLRIVNLLHLFFTFVMLSGTWGRRSCVDEFPRIRKTRRESYS